MLKKYYLFFDYSHCLNYQKKKSLKAILRKLSATYNSFTLRRDEFQKITMI